MTAQIILAAMATVLMEIIHSAANVMPDTQDHSATEKSTNVIAILAKIRADAKTCKTAIIVTVPKAPGAIIVRTTLMSATRILA